MRKNINLLELRDAVRSDLLNYPGKITDLAKKSGVARGHLYKFMAGNNQDISVRILQKIINGLNSKEAA